MQLRFGMNDPASKAESAASSLATSEAKRHKRNRHGSVSSPEDFAKMIPLELLKQSQDEYIPAPQARAATSSTPAPIVDHLQRQASPKSSTPKQKPSLLEFVKEQRDLRINSPSPRRSHFPPNSMGESSN